MIQLSKEEATSVVKVLDKFKSDHTLDWDGESVCHLTLEQSHMLFSALDNIETIARLRGINPYEKSLVLEAVIWKLAQANDFDREPYRPRDARYIMFKLDQ